jgi:aldehyde:ferredoxin oxidoreductase
VAGIGQAGERLVKIAGIMCGPSHYVRAAARGGMGALMGSKLLKAIVVRGKERPQYPDVRRFRQVVKQQNSFIKEHSLGLSTYGTSGGVVATETKGNMALRNWTLGNWSGAKEVSGQKIHETIKIKHTHCFACPIGCGHEEQVVKGPYRTPRGKGLEYETIAGFGGNCQVSNLEALSLANSLCNRYGLDTISASAVIAAAMEAYETGLIGPQDTGGLELRFGDADAMLGMVTKIALRQDIGRLLGEGVRAASAAAAAKIGNGATAMAIHVKGMELPYHDPRAFVSMGVNYATAVRGGCHLETLSYWNGYGALLPDLGYAKVLPPHESGPDQARLAYDYQNYLSVFNPLGLCKFIIKGGFGPERLAELVNSALGWEWTAEDLLTMGRRLFQLKRLINLKLGVTAADDTLPPRLLSEPRPTGEAAGVLPDMEKMLPIYYQLRGWDADGRPRPERLAHLGLPEGA